MGFRELARWRIFSESLANGLCRTDTLANLWRMGFGNWHVGESLANLWRMVCGELTRWRTFGQYLANVWRMAFGELTRW